MKKKSSSTDQDVLIIKSIDKNYISPYDIFLYKFDLKHTKSPSQLQEINKHKRIANLRDNEQ